MVEIFDLTVGLGQVEHGVLHQLLLLLLALVSFLGESEGLGMESLVVRLQIVDLPLEHLNIDVAKLQRRRLLQVICVDMQ